MSCDVYANGDEIACKAGGGKVIAAFPDVCLTPPPPPGGPIPVPYPDTSFSKDMKKGSKTVKIENKEIMLKNRSFYKTSPLGDEAATRSQGAGVITHVITGKTYFVSWSMDVLFEGQNVDRHTDLTTSNHASPAANAAVPMVNTAKYSPVQQDAKVPGKHKCECCGGAAHSKAQANGEYMTEEQFYGTAQNPKNAAVLAKVRANPKCRHLLPPAGKQPSGCNKYYVTSKREKANIENDWAINRPGYMRWKTEVGQGEPVAHRVPKAAGGCPAGQGNLAPTGKKCEKLEGELSALQETRINSFPRPE
ncbi:MULTISPECIES: DUF4150 domain-containing protein [Pseudomonas]|jgi:hypothetical protein|uniref:DUF4150 domain-containing protein n=2 Tax=Pseudomonas TaxID=286 RepID=A0ABN5G5Z0_PSEO1|nr:MULTISPECIES: DUF4150 domain-containing protein [Pseudomonas]EIK65381.1 hypothetical protein PflQ8_2925 [Pseudomonas fluorescens Q8r1-96]KIR17995.1 hypothetical protein PFLU4_13840 [Pseudomonas fluorescens]AOS37527.1 hypothetical protein A0U95_01785 [Pseudomonas brassicacearum]AUO46780.1 DUF4150 domain-containing protein [Pseudomonas ogarae]KAB0525883.1 DUF4150 domain-containing protein [Pseudomonas brassicacearum subsp. brassicacearum]